MSLYPVCRLMSFAIQLPGILLSPAESYPILPQRSTSCSGDPYLEALNLAVTLSMPLSDSLRTLAREDPVTVREIRQCLNDLRVAILRELASELMPKFMASKEFEVLLWEVEAHKQFSMADQKDTEAREQSEDGASSSVAGDSEGESEGPSEGGGTTDDDEARSLGSRGSLGSIGATDDGSEDSAPKALVPDGAVQRLLRKVSLPSTTTMHRAPLSLLDEARDEHRRRGLEAVVWLVSLDTHASLKSVHKRNNSSNNIDNSSRKEDTVQNSLVHEMKVDIVLPVGLHKGTTPDLDHTLIPQSLPSFLVPSGKYIWDSSDRLPPPTPRLISLAISTRDNLLLYVSALIQYRPLSEHDYIPTNNQIESNTISNRDRSPVGKTTATAFEASTPSAAAHVSVSSPIPRYVGADSLGANHERAANGYSTNRDPAPAAGYSTPIRGHGSSQQVPATPPPPKSGMPIE